MQRLCLKKKKGHQPAEHRIIGILEKPELPKRPPLPARHSLLKSEGTLYTDKDIALCFHNSDMFVVIVIINQAIACYTSLIINVLNICIKLNRCRRYHATVACMCSPPLSAIHD